MSTVLALLMLSETVISALPSLPNQCQDHQGRFERLVKQEIVVDQSGFARVQETWEVCHD
jgi:hypothetical protein